MTDTAFTDDSLVYVDVAHKSVVGPVEWQPNGKAKRVEQADAAVEDEEEANAKPVKGKKRRKKKRCYPWCSYRTAKRVYAVEGKWKEEDNFRSFDEVMALALKEPYWD